MKCSRTALEKAMFHDLLTEAQMTACDREIVQYEIGTKAFMFCEHIG